MLIMCSSVNNVVPSLHKHVQTDKSAADLVVLLALQHSLSGTFTGLWVHSLIVVSSWHHSCHRYSDCLANVTPIMLSLVTNCCSWSSVQPSVPEGL